jgi:hypothetical protein
MKKLWWTTWWGRILMRCGLTLASEAEGFVQERNEWQREISDACGATWHELHGGGATIYGTLEECVAQIYVLRRRAEGT